MEIRVLGAVLFSTDRQTDRCDEANNRFTHFCDCVKNLCFSDKCCCVMALHTTSNLNCTRSEKPVIPYSLWKLSKKTSNKYGVQRLGNAPTLVEREEAAFVLLAPHAV